MVVGYDHIAAERSTVFCLVDGGNARVDGYHKGVALVCELVDGFGIDTVALTNTVGYIVADGCTL